MLTSALGSRKQLSRVLRAARKRGGPLSQYEVARAIGVSRAWYGRLEAGQPLPLRLELIDRLAATLALDSEEHALVYHCASEITAQPMAALNVQDATFPWAIRLGAELWNAGSEAEVLASAASHLRGCLREAALICAEYRTDAGTWRLAARIADDKTYGRSERKRRVIDEALDSRSQDEWRLHPHLGRPGELGSDDLLRAPLRSWGHDLYVRHGFIGCHRLQAQVLSRSGRVGRLYVLAQQHSETARLALSTVAALASIAISD